MKTKVFIMMIFLGLGIASVKAQTSVIIGGAVDSAKSFCPAPAAVPMYVNGKAMGYSANDFISLYVNFGDGSDTTMMCPISQPWHFYSASLHHTYISEGFYNVQYIATGPDGNADTLNALDAIMVSNTCGNISGKIYNDANSNCLFDIGDVPLPYAKVELLYNNKTIGWSHSDQSGNYFFNAPSGKLYEVRGVGIMATYGYVVTCPISGIHSISSVPSSGNDFRLECTSGFDLMGFVSSQRFRPGFVSNIYPGLFNGSCLPVSGKAKLVIDDPRLTYVSAQNPPSQIVGDTLIWDFSNINNTNYWGWWNNSLGYVQVMTDVNAVLGDSICVKLIITPINGDVNPVNNTVIGCREISNSLDPNEKQVSPVGKGPNGNVSQNTEFTYNVQFQNTGTDTAYNIFILDTLDEDLNLNTFTPIGSSHPMQVDILTGNVARFTFSNIMLVDSFKNEPLSHGWVSYKISAKPALPGGTQFKNTAYIYFDFNSAVVTNTTLNTIEELSGVDEPSQNNFISVYPNPASSNIMVTFHEKQLGSELMLVDVVGKVVWKERVNQKVINVDVSNFPGGIYTLRRNSEANTIGRKVVIIK